MPIQSSGYYNDPALAQGFANLANMFKAPSGASLAGYANAAATRDKAARLSALFDYSKGPNFDQQQFDRMGVAAGLYNPSQSYYSVNVKDQGDTTRKLLDPVAAGATRFVPPSVASAYSVPTQQTGVVNVGQGEQATLPDGRVISGAPKPLTEAEVKGAILRGLPQADQNATVLGAIPVEKIIGPSGPQIVRRPDAVGQTPYVAPTEEPAYDKEQGTSLAKLNDSIFANAQTSLADQGAYKTILAAVDNPTVDQGAYGDAILKLKKISNQFGITNTNTGPAELLNALGNKIALQIRNPAGGAGMPGSLSDSDREFLRSMTTSLGNSANANRLLAQYYIAAQQRNIDLEGLRQNYIATHGGKIDEGFRTQMTDYMRNNDPTAAVREQVAAATGGPVAPASPANIPTVSSPEEAMKLPPGTHFRTPDGQLKVRP